MGLMTMVTRRGGCRTSAKKLAYSIQVVRIGTWQLQEERRMRWQQMVGASVAW